MVNLKKMDAGVAVREIMAAVEKEREPRSKCYVIIMVISALTGISAFFSTPSEQGVFLGFTCIFVGCAFVCLWEHIEPTIRLDDAVPDQALRRVGPDGREWLKMLLNHSDDGVLRYSNVIEAVNNHLAQERLDRLHEAQRKALN